ncbi:MAG: hypothetical protein AAF610_02810 [Pseudomonadota bacterium]
MDTLTESMRYCAQSTLIVAAICFGAAMQLISILINVPVAGGIVALVLSLFIALCAINYAGVVMRSAANGEREPPTMSAHEFTNMLTEDTLGTILVLLLPAGVGVLSQLYLSAAAATLIQFIVIALVPASLSLLFVNGSVPDAFNPIQLSRIVALLGPGYIRMPLFAVLVATGVAALTLIGLPVFLSASVEAYGALAILCYWGWYLHDHADKIGLEPRNRDMVREELDQRQENNALEDTMDEAFVAARTDATRAVQVLTALIEQDPDPKARREWVYERTRSWPNSLVSLRLSQPMIQRALELGDGARAVALTRDGIRINDQFRPAGPVVTMKVAALAAADEPELAVALLGDFGQRFPDHPQRVAASMAGARLALGELHDADTARRFFVEIQDMPQARNHPHFQALEKALASTETGAG